MGAVCADRRDLRTDDGLDSFLVSLTSARWGEIVGQERNAHDFGVLGFHKLVLGHKGEVDGRAVLRGFYWLGSMEEAGRDLIPGAAAI